MVARVCVCDHDLSLENSIHRSHSYTTKSRRTNEQIIAQQLDNLHAAARHNLFLLRLYTLPEQQQDAFCTSTRVSK